MNKRAVNGARALLERIDETALFLHYSMLGDGNVRQHDWEKLGAKLTGVEHGLWRFFMLGQALGRKEATELLGKPALDFLLQHKLCMVDKDKLSLGRLRLVRYWGMPLFIERSLAAPRFIGEDTKAALSMLPQLSEGRCLSLFTSSGLEVLPLAATDVELHFASLKAEEGILRANLELNSTKKDPGAWQFSRNGSNDYDLIVSNPPWIFQPPGIKIPAFASGGPDGLKCLRTFLKAASTRLKPEGLAVASFAFFAELENQQMENRLREFLAPFGLNYLLTVSSKLLMEPGVPVFNQLISLAINGSPQPQMEIIVKKVLKAVQKKRFAAVHLLKGRFWHGKKGRPPEQHITNYSDSYYGNWTI